MFGKKGSKGQQPTQADKPATAETKPAPKADEAPAQMNYISKGTVVEGNIVSHEDLTLDGTVKGDIKTSACLTLGQNSVVEGNILSSEAVVAGRITGTVESKGLLTIKSTCVIEGDIVTKSLNVESGSSFNGRCKVGDAADASDSNPVNRMKASAPQKPATK